LITIFIIDDSKFVREGLKRIFKRYEDLNVIGEAENPVDAFETFKTTGLPDIFVLDIQMPKMNGLKFLEMVNKQRPIPVIICSTLVNPKSSEAIDALRLGAVGLIEKPKKDVENFFDSYESSLISMVRECSKANIKYKPIISQDKYRQKDVSKQTTPNIIAIGSSTGGVQAIEQLLSNVKTPHDPIVIVQHMPQGFTKSFAERLNHIVPQSVVVEAQEGDMLYKNKIYIAPGDIHLQVKKNGIRHYVELKNFPKVSSHRPSVDVMFKSVAQEYGKRAKAFLLTGMGRDGASGLLEIRKAGSKTYTQDEKSCVVYGMPRVAKELGASMKDMTLEEMAKEINKE
jgi:two-component system chemotaxis response regulator CheB